MFGGGTFEGKHGSICVLLLVWIGAENTVCRLLVSTAAGSPRLAQYEPERNKGELLCQLVNSKLVAECRISLSMCCKCITFFVVAFQVVTAPACSHRELFNKDLPHLCSAI